MDIYALIETRYSIRGFLPQPIPQEAIERILEAARLAPSAANYQPWHFFVVRDPEIRSQLFPEPRQAWIAAAPVIIVACSLPHQAWVRSSDEKNHAEIDVAIAMEHIVLAATQEGLGSCWICAFNPQVIREALNLPAEMTPIAATPLGLTAVAPRPRSRKKLDDIVTWR